MKQQKVKQAYKSPSEPLLKKLGVHRIENFRRSDLTAELRDKANLAPGDEMRLMSVVELIRSGIPREFAEALVFSGALGSVSELPSLTAEEVEQIVNEAPVKRLLPAGFKINRELIDQWLQRVLPLTADEDSPARIALSEDLEQSTTDDDSAALEMEEASLDREHLNKLLNAFREQFKQGEAAIEAIAKSKSKQTDFSTVRETLVSIQSRITGVLDRFSIGEMGGFAAIDEDSPDSFVDEGLDPTKDIRMLEAELKHIELKLETLRFAAETGDEESSPAIALEETEADNEAPMKGE